MSVARSASAFGMSASAFVWPASASVLIRAKNRGEEAQDGGTETDKSDSWMEGSDAMDTAEEVGRDIVRLKTDTLRSSARTLSESEMYWAALRLEGSCVRVGIEEAEADM